MVLLKQLLNELETGGTAMSTSVTAPPVKWLYDSGKLKGNIVDYGAGLGRNSVFLRSKELKVYSYDPYKGNSIDGYIGVSNITPTDKFDVGFTCYVLNVTDVELERDIINKVAALSNKSYHIVRNMDVAAMIKDALARKDKRVVASFIKYGGDINNYNATDIMKFANVGTDTIKGFQRIPFLEKDGFQLIHTKPGYKIYTK